MKKLFLAFVAFASLFLNTAIAEPFNLDKTHATVGFKVKHLAITTVYGRFTDFDVSVDYDPQQKKFNSLNAIIQTASVNTDNQKRDEHLKSPDFFDANKNKTITFELKNHKLDEENGKLEGTITIAGITKDIVLNIDDISTIQRNGKTRVGISLSGKLNRNDFGVGKSFLANVISDDVKINVDIEIVQK